MKLKITYLQLILISIFFAGTAHCAPPNKTKLFSPNVNIPENCFLFGGYNLLTKEMLFGQRGKSAARGGGHYIVQQELTANAPIPACGTGQVVGFGVYREGNKIYIHRYCSLKAAGAMGNGASTVNPLLPVRNTIWTALMPEEYSEEVFTKLALATDLELEVDNDIFSSNRFKFDFEKQQIDPADVLTKNRFLDYLYDGTYWLENSVDAANHKLQEHRWGADNIKIGEGHYVPIEAWAPTGDTLHPNYEQMHSPRYGENISDAILINAKNTNLKVENPCEIGKKVAENIETPSKLSINSVAKQPFKTVTPGRMFWHAFGAVDVFFSAQQGAENYNNALKFGASQTEASVEGAVMGGICLLPTFVPAAATLPVGIVGGSIVNLSNTMYHNRNFVGKEYVGGEVGISGMYYWPEDGRLYQTIGGKLELYTSKSSHAKTWWQRYEAYWGNRYVYYTYHSETKTMTPHEYDPRPQGEF